MKRTICVAAVLLLAIAPCATAIDAIGTVFGTLTTAQTMGQGKGAFGLGVGAADATSFFGTFTYGLGRYTDGRLKFGLVDDDPGDASLALGADFKYQFWSVSENRGHPFDMAAGAFFEFVDLENASVIEFGGQLLGSYPFQLENNNILAPYGRFNIRLERVSWDNDFPGGDDGSDSDIEFGLNGGLRWAPSSNIDIYGEFQLDGNDGVFFGVDFRVI